VKFFLKKIRMFFLLRFKYKLLSYGSNVYFGKNLFLRKKCLSVGDDIYIGSYCHISVKRVKIEDFTMLASYVSIIGGDHKFDVVGVPMIKNKRDKEKEVVIEKDVWIGHGSTIMHGVTIGEGSIVGARSVVTKDIPPYSIVAGSPAKVIRMRFSEKDISTHSFKINNNK
jgi:chloramphenicol O-acetyltransferase type B